MNKLVLPERREADRADWGTYEQGPRDSAPQLGLKDLLMVLSRRKWLLAGTIVVVTLGGLALTESLTPVYTATTSVMVDPREQQVVDVQSVIAGMSPGAETMESEIEVIRSDALAQRAIAETGLDRTAEFNPEIAAAEETEPGLLGIDLDIAGAVRQAKAYVFGEPEQEPVDPEAAQRGTEAAMVSAFQSRLSVGTIGRSRVLEISFTSEDPRRALEVANAVASLYITQQLEAKFDARQRAMQWLSERLSRLRTEVETAEQAVERFRAENGMLEGRDARLVNEQITQLTTQVIGARAEYSALQAQLDSLQGSVRNRGARAALEGVDNPVVTNLRSQEATLRQREAELLNTLGPRHPQVVDIKAQIADIQGQIAAEANSRVQSLSSQVAVAADRLRSLEAAMGRLQDEATRLNTLEIDYRSLEREAAANRTLFENFLARYKETQEVDLDQPNAWIVSNASLPLRPSFPNRTLMVGLAFVLACGIGLVLVFVAEQMETGIQTREDIERMLHARALGVLPLVRSGRLRRAPPQDYVIDRPASAFTQSIKGLFTSLVIANQRHGKGNVILITSAVPGEGKSSVASSLSRIIAVAGRKVLLIDCDLRRPQMHAALGLENRIGLAEFLNGSAGLSQVVQRDPKTGADVILAGGAVDHPEEVIRHPLMDQLLFNVSSQYDLVVLDAPPVLPVSDTRILAEKASQTVVVVRWRSTGRRIVEMAMRQLDEAGANMAGVVLNQVDAAKGARYGSGEIEYYIGRRGSYFRN
ncbi:GumC family protein [Arenibaculum sp.]|uniref:GumC family protein n=1 Tax=Arenibaculum sp. TaxID=2865862 RepID=UPI002E1670F1|nr:polysaccharide biosynthesis tyrosine autokinase [Arenibaculum sp.]